MMLVPCPVPVARPPAVIVAAADVAEAHVTEAVKFCVLLSLKVPVAVNCCVCPLTMDGVAGVTAIEIRLAAVTVSTAEPETEPEVALITLVPCPVPVARPTAVIVAAAGVAEAQITEAVKFCVLPSL
jgi:hypothetical protein